MTTPKDAILARRRLTNKLIAAHDAARLKPFFAPDVKLIVGDGGLILGAEAVVEAFAAQFADPDFITFVRTPEVVQLDGPGARAAESGRWIARSRQGDSGGTYAAAWGKSVGQWVIEAELYTTL